MPIYLPVRLSVRPSSHIPLFLRSLIVVVLSFCVHLFCWK